VTQARLPFRSRVPANLEIAYSSLPSEAVSRLLKTGTLPLGQNRKYFYKNRGTENLFMSEGEFILFRLGEKGTDTFSPDDNSDSGTLPHRMVSFNSNLLALFIAVSIPLDIVFLLSLGAYSLPFGAQVNLF